MLLFFAIFSSELAFFVFSRIKKSQFFTKTNILHFINDLLIYINDFCTNYNLSICSSEAKDPIQNISILILVLRQKSGKLFY